MSEESESWGALLRKLGECGVSGARDEQSDIVRRLVHLSLQLENRRSLNGDDVTMIVKLLADWSELYVFQLTPSVTPTSGAPALLDLMKLLRNICAGVPLNQSHLLSTDVLDIVSSLFTALISHITSHTPNHLDVVVMTTLQLLGNMCVTFQEGQEKVWKKYFPDFFTSVLRSFGEDELVSMVIHNCTCMEEAKNRRKELITTKGGVAILAHIVSSKEEGESSEWRSIFLRSFLERVPPSELHHVLVPDQSGLWTALLDTLCRFMNVEGEVGGMEGEWPEWEDSECVHLVEVWRGEVERMLGKEAAILSECSRANHKDDLSPSTQINVKVVSSALRLLCALSIREKYSRLLQNQLQLMDTATALLRKLSVLDGTINSTRHLNSLRNTERQTERGREGVLFGLKRDLLQLISSLLYHCPPMQERIRNSDSIPLILNQCHIDHSNPYIMQWAVLAIRNLCEGNATNQEVIARLETRGVAEATVEEFRPGCEVEVTRRGKLRMKGN